MAVHCVIIAIFSRKLSLKDYWFGSLNKPMDVLFYSRIGGNGCVSHRDIVREVFDKLASNDKLGAFYVFRTK